ncbi:MAG: response regulator [Alphaproteobacteria bacterium]|nr:response regulator [Alphaproteobacteria bacterium]
MPERGNGSDGPVAGNSEKKGNGHPAPSTVLVVEDEVLVRMAVADYLRHCGYRVLEAKTGEEAQAILRAGELVEILFSDVDLGAGINGLDLARWVREHFRDIRIILTSGVMRMTDSMRNLCDSPLLNKPYGYDDLAANIKAVLGALGQRSGG